MRLSTCWSSMAMTLPAFGNAESDPGFLHTLEERVPHRHSGGQLPRVAGQLVEGKAEAGLGEHLRGLAVAGVAAADLGDDALAAALADEDDLEGALCPDLLAGPLARRRHRLQQQPARRRQLGKRERDSGS